MSSPSEPPGHEISFEKSPGQASLRELPQTFEIDGGNGDDFDDDIDTFRKGFTKNDRRDMKRMGKHQELMVRR